jgi:hypothetical protein
MLLTDALRIAAAKPRVQQLLSNLKRDAGWGHDVSLTTDVEETPGYPTVLRLKQPRHGFQNEQHEIAFAARLAQSAIDWVVLLGRAAPTIDGFFLDGTPFQLKNVGNRDPQRQPLGVIEAVDQTWRSARNRPVPWRGVTVYVNAPGVPTDWISRRWSEPTDPRLAPEVFHSGIIGRVVVYAHGGTIELPLRRRIARAPAKARSDPRYR